VVRVNPLETAQALAQPVGLLGGRWMASKATYAYGSEFGFSGRTFYYIGRGGALGDVRPEVVSSAMVFFPHAYVEGLWREGRAVMDPTSAMSRFSECCWAWARQRLSTAPSMERANELMAQVIDRADAALFSLFAGWREAARPSDAPALAGHLLHVLREYRGGAHAAAVLAVGLTPLEATVAGPFGASGAQAIGWDGELPACTDELASRREEAEHLTDRMAARAFDALSPEEREELVGLVSGFSQAAIASSKSV
jgi:hypothetical protein